MTVSSLKEGKIMKAFIKKSVLAAILVIPGLLMMMNEAPAAERYNLTVAGASPGGLWSLLGAGLDSALKASYPGSTVTYQTSGGGIPNVAVLARGSADMALIEDSVLQMAREGKPPFREPIGNIQVLSSLYTWAPMQALMRKGFAEEYGIETFADIAKVKPPITIAINKRGNIASNVAADMLDAIGATPEQIESWGGEIIYAASGEQSELIQDRRADMFINSLFINQSSIMQAASNVDLKLLPLSQETISQVNEEAGTHTFVIPGGSYEWAPREIPTISISTTLAVRDDMDEETAYNLTKAFYENYEQIAKVHPAMYRLKPNIMASVEGVPFHPGALRYLKEAGLR
ncbi:TAXI family TRAP transporter solute-binding subunit [Salinicola sp. V024]|jgi:hypothetical protein|uniref:TAXI family TRAP transporter solute-binding subunit n=1 Tax=Salinicola sp. V024 TaxID=3459609 RepID=UPI002EB4BB42|nr:TAXI family TRAP transporter solute-binding subunit [Pseudomonadota bacterium]